MKDCELKHNGKILPLLVFLLPCLFAAIGLLIDGSSVLSTQNDLQNSVDLAALTAAYHLSVGASSAEAEAAGLECVQQNGFAEANLTFHFDQSGQNAGQIDSITTNASFSKPLYIMPMFKESSKKVFATATAGYRPEKHQAAIVVLESCPAELNYASVAELLNSTALAPLLADNTDSLRLSQLLGPLGILSGTLSNLLKTDIITKTNFLLNSTLDQTLQNTHLAMPMSLVAGFELEGLGHLTVDGAVHVNTQWGGVDQNGDPVGANLSPPHALSCMPVLSTTRLVAPSIRVVGGVDTPNSYLPLNYSEGSPLTAGALPVADPFENLNLSVSPVGSQGHKVVIALPSALVSEIIQNRLTIVPLPLRNLASSLLSPVLNLLSTSNLVPGRYDSLTIISLGGSVNLSPGIYEITGVNPVTQISLTVVGPIQAQGVSYVLDLSSTEEILGSASVAELLPSCVVLPVLPGGIMTPSQAASDILVYQASNDRRPLIVESLGLLSGNNVKGTIYAKNGHLTLLLNGVNHDLSIVVGTLRIATVLDSRITPSKPFPAAVNVSLLK